MGPFGVIGIATVSFLTGAVGGFVSGVAIGFGKGLLVGAETGGIMAGLNDLQADDESKDPVNPVDDE